MVKQAGGRECISVCGGVPVQSDGCKRGRWSGSRRGQRHSGGVGLGEVGVTGRLLRQLRRRRSRARLREATGCWSLLRICRSASISWRFTLLFSRFADALLFLAPLLLSPAARVLPPLTIASLSSASFLRCCTSPLAVRTLQSALHMVEILCCHGDAVKLLQQGIQGGEEPPQRGFCFGSLPPADVPHGYSWTEVRARAQAQAHPRGLCEAAGAGRSWTPRSLGASVDAVGCWRGLGSFQRRQAQRLTVAGGGGARRRQLHALETDFMAELRGQRRKKWLVVWTAGASLDPSAGNKSGEVSQEETTYLLRSAQPHPHFEPPEE